MQYKHSNGEISTVNIEAVGIRKTRIRAANLPPEIPENVLRCALVKYGEVHEITNETWANKYRFPVLNGIRISQIRLSSHIPSHLMIAGYRVLIAYDGQPMTCYTCGETDHLHHQCPKKRISREKGGQNHVTSWADIVARGADQEIQETHVEVQIDTQATGDKMTKDTQLADNRDSTLPVPPTQTTGCTSTEQHLQDKQSDDTAESTKSQPTPTLTYREEMYTDKEHGTPPGNERPHTEHEKRQEQKDDGAEQTNQREGNRIKGRWQTPTTWAEDVELSLDTAPSTTMSPSSPKRKKKLKTENSSISPERGRSRGRNTGKKIQIPLAGTPYL
jgi:hypothetical protein